MEVIDNTEMRHFEVREENVLAILEYQVQEKKVFLTRTHFPPGFEEDGRAEEMMEKTLDLIEPTKMRVVPMTRKVKDFFKRHPERKHMLPVGIHL